MSYKRLYRSITNRRIAGIAGGIAEYFDIDPTLVRLLWLVAIISGGIGVPAYIIAWIVIPEAPEYVAPQPGEGGTTAAESVPGPEPSNFPQSNNGSQKGLAFVGVFLILLGGVFLLRQLFPWFAGYSWSLLLIVLGVAIIFLPGEGVQIMTNKNCGLIPLGILLILAGILVFLVNLGYGSWDFLWQIWRLWPLLIILIGVKLLLPRQISRWVSYGFWIIAAVALIVLFMTTPKSNFEQTELGGLQHYSINRNDYPGVTAGKVNLTFGGGRLVIGSLTNEWLEGDFGGWAAQPSVQSSQNTLIIGLKQSRRFPGPWRMGGSHRWTERDYNWDLKLSPELDWDLSMETGAMKGEADLSGVRLRGMSIKMGAGDLDLSLGNPSGNTQVRVDAGASNIKIRVPEGTAVKVKMSGALVNNNLNDLGWTNNNRTYSSPGYDQAVNHLDIILNMAVGNFELIR